MNKPWREFLTTLLLMCTAFCSPMLYGQTGITPQPVPLEPIPKPAKGYAPGEQPIPNAEHCMIFISDFNFGAYTSGQSSSLNSTFSITVECDSFQTIRLTVAPSIHAPGGNNRAMKNILGNDMLMYQLFTDSSHGTIWGDGTRETQPITHSGTGMMNINVFGSMFPLQNVIPGNYADDVQVTVEP